MATRSRVRIEMHKRLSEDSIKQILKAGGVWEEMPMGFYYDSGDEVITEKQVDIATQKVMLRILELDKTQLPHGKLDELGTTVNSDTTVSDAIDTIRNMSLIAS